MRKINKIIVHCSATKEGQNVSVEEISKWHKAQGYSTIGYHYVVLLDGTVKQGRPIDQVGAHTQGHNADSIGICYVGGLDASGKAKDTRTQSQKNALAKLLRDLVIQYPNCTIKGHRDYSPDLNKDGKITSNEFIKACPCFDASEEYQYL